MQASPTKEAVASVPTTRLSKREVQALRQAEAEAAMGWVRTQWPGLAGDITTLLADLEPGDPDADARTLLERAECILSSGQKVDLHPIAGALPIRWDEQQKSLAQRVGTRMPWSSDRARRKGPLSDVPVSGSGGDDIESGNQSPQPPDDDESDSEASRVRVGIPYDEWDHRSARYRTNFVNVFEVSAPAPIATSHHVPPGVLAWCQRSHDWTRVGRLDDGPEIDLDGIIDDRVRRLLGQDGTGRVYASVCPAPRDTATAVLLDTSGSLSAESRRFLKTELACVDSLSVALAAQRERFAVFSFNGETRERVLVRVLRDFNEQVPRLPSRAAIRPAGYTRLGAPIRHVTSRLSAIPANKRLLLSIGDAMPCDQGYEGEYAISDVRKAVEEATRQQVTVFHICVGSSTVSRLDRMFGRGRYMQVDHPGELPRALAASHRALTCQ